MGLLDDAIREHLDLQRRRGADPAEIERAERDALGPVRREPLAGEEPVAEEAPGAYAEVQSTDLGTSSSVATERPDEEFDDYDDADDQEVGDDDEWEEYGDEDGEDDEEPGAAAPGGPPNRSAAVADPLDQPTELMPLAGIVPTPAPPEEPLSPPTPAPAEDLGPEPRGVSEDPDRALGDTVSYEVNPGSAQSGESEEGDVLEETPEFLQDTPDHDRLWFEQRPPRDFDFDS